MHAYSKLNLNHPLITAYKVDQAAQKVFKKEISSHSGGKNEGDVKRRDARICVQVFRCSCGLNGMGE